MMSQHRKQLLVLDRLSSLPDEILVDILSLLPLKSAIITDTLSKRWRHLWTRITSVVIIIRSNACIPYDLITSVDQSIHRLTSPFIHTVILDFNCTRASLDSINTFDSWQRRFCQRNVLHLGVLFPCLFSRFMRCRIEWPSCIFRTRSLVSIDMRSAQVHYPYDGEELIDLPNLRKLSVNVTPEQCDWLIQVTESCPLLEDLSLEIRCIFEAYDVECSCPNLRRLSIRLSNDNPCKVVINAPKLEYLDASLQRNSTLCIGDKPISRLHQVRFYIFRDISRDLLSTDVEGCDLQLYKAISNVRSLNLRFDTVSAFTTFPNLTRLTLDLGFPFKIRTVMSLVELCPVLDILTLRFHDNCWIGEGEWLDIPNIRTLERVKEIGIDVCYNMPELEEHFSKMIEYLLKSSSVLERFCFSVVVARTLETSARYAGSERMLCDFLYNCPRASIDCEVSFTGQFWLMTRKDGSDVLTPIGDAAD